MGWHWFKHQLGFALTFATFVWRIPRLRWKSQAKMLWKVVLGKIELEPSGPLSWYFPRIQHPNQAEHVFGGWKPSFFTYPTGWSSPSLVWVLRILEVKCSSFDEHLRQWQAMDSVAAPECQGPGPGVS